MISLLALVVISQLFPTYELPLYSDGGSVVCLPAGTGDGGCLTVGAQNISGNKTFKGGVVGESYGNFQTIDGAAFVSTPWLRSQYIQPTVAQPVVILGNRSVDDLNDAVQVGRLNQQPDGGGSCLGVRNGTALIGGWRCNGQATAIGTTAKGAFLVGQLGSGTVALECDDTGNGCYLPVLGHMKNQAHHGVLTVMNDGPTDGGTYYPLVLKGIGGPDTSQNIVLEVDAYGKLTIPNSFIQTVNSQGEPPCTGANDEGQFGYVRSVQRISVCAKLDDGGYAVRRVKFEE